MSASCQTLSCLRELRVGAFRSDHQYSEARLVVSENACRPSTTSDQQFLDSYN